MIQEIKNIKATPEVVKKFGIILAVLLGTFGSISLWKSGTAYQWLYPVGAVVLISALFFPKLLKFIYIPWMTVATIIGWCVTRIILSVLFYLIMTPFGLIGRLFGNHFLDETLNPQAESHWIPRDQRSFTRTDLERQF